MTYGSVIEVGDEGQHGAEIGIELVFVQAACLEVIRELLDVLASELLCNGAIQKFAANWFSRSLLKNPRLEPPAFPFVANNLEYSLAILPGASFSRMNI